MRKQYKVYTIVYENQVMYVGKTNNFKHRKWEHRNQIGNSKYSAIPVEADLNKVKFNVVAVFDNEADALKHEDELILQYNTMECGWNKNRSGLVCSDKEYILAYQRDYTRAHREEKAAYRAAHKEEKAAYNREYYQAHKEEMKAYMRDYNREYYQAHREEKAAHMREYMREYRARKKADGVRKVS